MAKIFYEQDCNQAFLKGKKVAVIGYGSQGHAHSLNLRDSGVDVTVGLYEGSPSKEKAKARGLKVANTGEAVKAADIIMILATTKTGRALPQRHRAEPHAGKTLAFAHGSISLRQSAPGGTMLSWSLQGPGQTVRSEFEEGKGVPSSSPSSRMPVARHWRPPWPTLPASAAPGQACC